MRRFLIILLCWLTYLPAAFAAQVVLTAARDSESVKRFTQDLSVQRPEDQISFIPLNELTQKPLAADIILITLDQISLQWRIEQASGPTTLAMRASKVLTEPQRTRQSLQNVTLLWDDQPAERQMQLAKLSLPNAEKVGLLYDPQSQFLLPQYYQAAEQLGLSLEAVAWTPGHNRRPLLSLLNQTDFILGINAPQLYNANTVKSLLLTSYEQKKPLIGPNAAFVRAGSLTSSYSDQDDWLQELQDWLATPLAEWPLSAYPKHYKVLSNRQVARALSLDPPPDDQLKALLISGETP